MKTSKIILLGLFISSTLLILCGCEKYTESDEINDLMKTNDISIVMKVDNSDSFTITKTYEDDAKTEYFINIDVMDTFSMRGEVDIEPGKEYNLSFTLKNVSADPVISYSFWKKPITSLRHYTFNGEDGSPPSSTTQEFYDDWVTFEETFETKENEDSLTITLHCAKGLFCIKNISIEEISE